MYELARQLELYYLIYLDLSRICLFVNDNSIAPQYLYKFDISL